MTTWYVADTITVTFAVTSSGTPTDATTIVAFMRTPGGVLSNPSTSHPGTGTYTVDFTPTEIGIYTLGATATLAAGSKVKTVTTTVEVHGTQGP